MPIKNKYNMDQKLFFRHRFPWMVLMMLPSLAVDGVILWRAVTLQPVALTADGQLDLWNLTLALAANFTFLKSGALFYYFQLRWQRRRSHVTVLPGKVLYYKRKLVGRSFNYGYPFFIEYRINSAHMVHRRPLRSLVIRGDIEAVYLLEDGKSLHHRRSVRRLVIPGYFSGMEQVLEALQQLERDGSQIKP